MLGKIEGKRRRGCTVRRWFSESQDIVSTLLGPDRLGQVVKRLIHSHNGTKLKFLSPVTSSKHSMTIPGQRTLPSEGPSEHGCASARKQATHDTRIQNRQAQSTAASATPGAGKLRAADADAVIV